MSTPGRPSPFPFEAAFGGSLALRLVLGCVLVLVLGQISVDDYFRVFHAAWWWEHPSYSSSNDWLPAYMYVYGTAIGLSGDMLLVPRFASLGLLLATGLVIGLDRSIPSGARWAGATWLLFAPLALVLGTVPLSETLTFLLVVGGLTALGRYGRKGRSGDLLLAAVLYLGAAMVRYEVWPLLAVFTGYALLLRPAGRRSPVTVALALLPWSFPVVWTLMLFALLGEPFSYLRGVAEDHFGTGSVVDAIASPTGWVIGLQAALGTLPLFVAGRALARGKARLGELLWEAHLLVALVVAVALVAGDNIPSQLPTRLLFPLVVFAAVPIGRLLDGALARRRLILVVACGAGLLAAFGLAHAFQLADDIPATERELAEIARAEIDDGAGEGTRHVLIEHSLPEGAAIYVQTNRPELVHIDSLGIYCPPLLLGQEQLEACEPVPWADQVTMAVVSSNPAVGHLELSRWQRGERLGCWVVYRRGDSGVSLAPR